MLHVATCLWDANDASNEFSRCYDESWVERLYRGFARNLTRPFRFVCFTDRLREFSPQILQQPLTARPIAYGSFTEPYRLNEPMILVGLDTIIVRNIDHLADYCLSADKIALPRDFKHPDRSINGVALVPKGWRRIYDEWSGENDMEWLRNYPWRPLNDEFPAQVVSYKMDVRWRADVLPAEARIVYFHGKPKAQDLGHIGWVRDNWH